MKSLTYGIVLAILIGGGLFFFISQRGGNFNIPKGESTPLESIEEGAKEKEENKETEKK